MVGFTNITNGRNGRVSSGQEAEESQGWGAPQQAAVVCENKRARDRAL